MSRTIVADPPPGAGEPFVADSTATPEMPQAQIDALYEEFCERHVAGNLDAEQDILRRFPQWREQLRVMFDCHRLLEAEDAAPDFPSAGEEVAGFRLVQELGRGARGQVWLATQTDLANRQVVLKITPLDGAEHLSLARLQHTNIVPVYSVQDDPVRNIRILCMPYFGRATLASALKSLVSVPLAARTGRQIALAMEEPQAAAADAVHSALAPARDWLAKLNYAQAACWIAARLAEALHYAHERGLVHLDVKPSNILLATDGQPMLLDFHLARGPIAPDGVAPEKLGGTPAYMPPEQAAAMRAIGVGLGVEGTVDARADVYALGAVLHEMLGGSLPQTGEPASLAGINLQVSDGLNGIVAKCLAPRAEDRYATASALADDLRRHLTDQPLKGAPNRRLAERWRKWRRRKPRTLRAAGMLLIVLASAAIVLGGAWWHVRDRREEAQRALRNGQAQLDRGDAADAAATLERGLSLVEDLPFSSRLATELRELQEQARRASVIDQLHQLAERIRPLLSERLPPEQLQPLAALCDEFWERRQDIVASLDAKRDTQAATDLLDVAILRAELQVRLASPAELAEARRAALSTLDTAEALFGPSRALTFQRGIVADDLPPSGNQEDTLKRELQLPPARTAWDHYAIGRALLAVGKLTDAHDELSAARAMDPSGLWPNFYYGVCAYRLDHHQDAAAAFSVCIGAAPNLAASYHNRAMAYEALGRANLASQDRAKAEQLAVVHDGSPAVR